MGFAKIAAFFTNTAGRAMNKTTMVATAQGFAKMIYADGVVEDAELKAAYAIFKRNPKLSVFGNEAVKELDTALDLWETSKRQARVETNRALEAWAANATKEDKEDFLNSILDLMDSDGDQDDAELAVAKEFATLTGLDLDKFL
ncbi:MAG: TerB family tellurite resistance protein [Aeromonas popoffii]|uniref:TerB family tellurite resistance protein n=1 Tax=Aeromonas popoffii TaxID=70856 RepID=UPI003F33923A